MAAAAALVPIEEYLQMGVQTVWVIDPMRRAAFSTDDDGDLIRIKDELVVSGTAVRLSLVDLFAPLNRLQAKSL